MGSNPSNQRRADHAMRAAFIDDEAPAWPEGQCEVAGAVADTVRNLMHLCDLYRLDFRTLVVIATGGYIEDQPDLAEAADELDRDDEALPDWVRFDDRPVPKVQRIAFEIGRVPDESEDR